MKTLLALSIVVLLAGCAGTTTTTTTTGSSSGKEVGLYDNSFEDGNLTLAAGSTVKYTNEGHNAHTVTIHWVGDPLTTTKIDKTLQPGESVSYTFATAGTYHVWCRFHGQMTSGMATVVHAT
jgi:plastocyanin